MAVGRRSRNLVASRRRVADDGEDDDNDMASADLDSQSELSALTGVNDNLDRVPKPSLPPLPRAELHTESANGAGVAPGQTVDNSNAESQPPTFSFGVDVEAMANGFEIPPGNHDEDIIQFDDADLEEYVPEAHNQERPEPTCDNTPTATTPSQLKPPPVALPHKAGLQPHDPIKGHTARPSQSSSSNKPPTRWSHDLHDSVREPVQPSKSTGMPAPTTASKIPSLSTTFVLGLVSMRVMLPGMKEPIVYEKMPLKHHVRMPDLRPPLRRDKPVRIAIEDNPPRYIFPSVERSFIFIPRAQRPNQQSRGYKNRGYLSQFSSRRGSVYGGSNQGASGAVSRRSSVARDGFISPAESVVSRAPYGAPTGPAARPVVRLPTAHRPENNPSMQLTNGVPIISSSLVPYPLPSRPALRENRDVSVPMYQPRPQKTVSLDSLESPRTDRFQAPRQQEQQPFHHQVPSLVNGQDQLHHVGPSQTAAETPAAVLPDQAVNAQPFQPGQPVYYPSSFATSSPYYYFPPTSDGQGLPYAPMAPYPMYPPPGAFMMPMVPPAALPNQLSGVNSDPMYSQESNGTMYYYNPVSHYPGDQADATQAGPYAMGGSEGAMKADAPDFYYQPHPVMYYPTH